MAIKDWHWGRLALLWFLCALYWVAFLLGVLYVDRMEARGRDMPDTILAELLWWALLITCTLVTWRWLTARKSRGASNGT